MALAARDRRQPVGLPLCPARRAAQPRGRHRHRPPGRREGLRLDVRPGTRLVLHRQEAVRPEGRHRPAHLVPRPVHPDEPEPGPRAVHPLQVRRPGHRHHRLLAVLHQRPGRRRDPRHRRPRLVEDRPHGHALLEHRLPRLAGGQPLRCRGGCRREQPRHLLRHAARRPGVRDRRQGPGPADRARRAVQAHRPADRRRRHPAPGTRPHPQLALLDLRPRRLHPPRGHRPARRGGPVGVSGAGRAEPVQGGRPTAALPPREPPRGPTRNWSSTASRRATSCTRRPTRGTGRRAPPCRGWRHRPAATSGRCGSTTEQLDSIAG